MSVPKLINLHIYHQCPDDLLGSTIHPLRLLETVSPETYATAIAKYNDHPKRRALPLTPIPLLSCEWRDVVQCSPIHPHHLFRAQVEAGIGPKPQEFFEIPLDRVHAMPAVLFQRDADGNPEYEAIDWSTFAELTEVPAATRSWYRQLARRGQRGASFVGVPHVMVKGSIDISGCNVIEWSTSPV